MILRHGPRSQLRPGTAPKCGVAAATLFYRVREFNSMDIGCSMPFGLSVREQFQASLIKKSRHGFWVQIFFVPLEEHELKIPVLKNKSISCKQLGVFFSHFCLFLKYLSHLLCLNIFFSICSYCYSVCKSHMEALAFALNVLGDLFQDGKVSTKAAKRIKAFSSI